MKNKVLKKDLVFKGKFVNVFELHVDVGSKNPQIWETIRKGNDSVAVVALDEKNDIHLIREYLPALDKVDFSLPKGEIEDGESPEEAAQREMQEEIGYNGDLTRVACFSLSPGSLEQLTYIFLAQNLRKSSLNGEEQHFIERKVIPFEKAVSYCMS